ncbi:MAG: hypothetical protein HZA81_04090 [Candidatus Taylorbacteria bacterium]|nr:hypothetical protein [Candidatus Taylorbacteria bacterium]
METTTDPVEDVCLGAMQTERFLEGGSDLRGLAAWEMDHSLVPPLRPSPPPPDNVIIPH